MKNLLVLLLLLFCFGAFATETVPSKIKHVTIYRSTAKIKRDAKTKVTAGSNTIRFGGLATNVIPNSIQIGLSKNVKLLTVTFQTNYLKDANVSREVKEIRDSIEILTGEIDWGYRKVKMLSEEQQMIAENKKLGSSQEGVKVEELMKLDAFYNKRMLELERQIFELKGKDNELKLNKSRLQNQLNQLTANAGKTTGEIVVEVTSDITTMADFELSYIVNNVSWTPIYDMYSNGTDDDIKMVYKANVVQYTGIDWDQVSITISTGNPSLNNDRPILNPRYLTYYNPPQYRKSEADYESLNSYVVVADEKAKAPLKEVSDKVNYGSYIPMTVSENQLNVEFIVKQNYNIPSDGKPHMVSMTEFSIPADYEYHTVPIKDHGAYLLAKVSDWGRYNLLAGNANIFFDNTYIGKSYINPLVTADTLIFSFGRDDRIIVKREKVFSECVSKTLLGNKKHVFVYEISIRNTKSKEISIDLLDQIPLNNLKDVEVVLDDNGGATYNEKTGALLWKLKLKPNETQKVRFKYTVKHPKNKVVQNM